MTLAPRRPQRAPVLLLPPSEGKAEGGRRRARAGTFDAALATERATLVAALARAVGTPAGAAKVLGCRGDLLDRARAATAALVAGDAPRLPAAERYTGVVWEHLGPLDAIDRRRVLVPSAVYGITTAADPIADYRLKLSVTLPGLGRPDRYWAGSDHPAARPPHPQPRGRRPPARGARTGDRLGRARTPRPSSCTSRSGEPTARVPRATRRRRRRAASLASCSMTGSTRPGPSRGRAGARSPLRSPTGSTCSRRPSATGTMEGCPSPPRSR